MFEHKTEPLLPPDKFVQRLGRHTLFAVGILIIALAIGIAGYMLLDKLNFVDALLNASMILSGMGPIDTQLASDAAKIFASLYALFSGVIFISSVGIVAAPLIHRLFHHFHVDEQE